MAKVKISMTINDYNLDTIGYFNNNVLSFKDKEDNIIFDLNNYLLTKETDETIIKMNFKLDKNNLEIFVKETNNKFYTDFTIKQLKNESSSVIISYQINEDIFNLKISFKEV